MSALLTVPRPDPDAYSAQLSTQAFTEKLAPLSPPPRANQVLYAGVLAGSAALRAEVVPRVATSTEAQHEARAALKHEDEAAVARAALKAPGAATPRHIWEPQTVGERSPSPQGSQGEPQTGGERSPSPQGSQGELAATARITPLGGGKGASSSFGEPPGLWATGCAMPKCAYRQAVHADYSPPRSRR